MTLKLTLLKHLTTCCLIFLAFCGFAQKADTFKAFETVVSANSGESIPDGLIMTSKTKGYKWDSSERFTLYNLAPGQHDLSFTSFDYDSEDTVITITDAYMSSFRWTISADCWKYSKEKALKDIQYNKQAILLQGGIAPVVYTTDKGFESKYKVTFHDLGCVAADRQECLIAYNRTIFEYLDKTYGKKWRKEIRKDAIGLKNK